MRYLLLSVLVVCMIGVMIPSAFGETYTIESAQGSSLVDCAPNNCFIPFLLHIEIGDTVIFQNNDNASHTFTSGTPGDGPQGFWDSSMVQSGDSYTVTFDTEAEYPYYCMLHPWTKGTIIVGEGGENSVEKSVREAEEAAVVEAEKAEAVAVEAEIAAEKAAKLLLPDTYTLHDVSYGSTSTPNSGEIPYIEHLNAFVKEEEVYAAIMIWKFLPAQDVPEMATKMSDAWGLYAEVDLTPDSSCVHGILEDTPAFLCSQDDVIVYAGGTGINFKKYTKEVLNNLKGIPTQSSEGCGAGTVLVNGACQLASTGSNTGLPEDYDPLFYDVMLYYGMTAAQIIGVAVAAGGGIIVVIFVVRKRSKTPEPAAKPKPVKQKPVEKKETSAFCENCGNTLNPKAKFCGSCGTART